MPAKELPEHDWFAPIAEIVGFNAVNWAIDRYVLKADWAKVSGATIWRNARFVWTFDTDDFNTNQFLHPYSGSFYYTAARSSGFGFWESSLFAFGGSLMWKLAGEVGPASINDQITTPIAGTILGEALFRISRLVLGGGPSPNAGRQVGALLISPASQLNYWLLDGHIKDPDPPVPSYRGHVSAGVSLGNAAGEFGSFSVPFQARFAFQLTYGLPEDVRLHLPFDHFEASLELSSATAQPWAYLHDPRGPEWLLEVRGLALGGETPTGEPGRTLYGLYGLFDFGGPVLVRVGETGFGPGAAIAEHLARDVLVEATFIAALTFGTAGGYAPRVVDRDYAYGVAAFFVADGKLFWGDRTELHLTGRAVAVPDAVGGGSEELVLGTASARVRIAGPHAVSLDGTASFRNVALPGSSYRERSVYAGASYAFLFGSGR